MECATLANGVKMPMQGFGVFQVPPEDTERVVLDAVAAGYRAISALDTGAPSMLDCSRPTEVRRFYGYLNDPQLTTIE